MTPVERARELVAAKVPFLHQGRDFNGIDCIGAVVYAHQYPLDKVPPYPKDPIDGRLSRELRRAFGAPVMVKPFDPVMLSDADVVLMQYKGPIRHAGLVARRPGGGFNLIHTDSTLGYVTEHILDAKWLRRIEEVYRP